MPTTFLYLSNKLEKKINAVADRMGKPSGQVMREALSRGLPILEGAHSDSAELLLKVAKLGGKGPTNLARNHDQYLEAAWSKQHVQDQENV